MYASSFSRADSADDRIVSLSPKVTTNTDPQISIATTSIVGDYGSSSERLLLDSGFSWLRTAARIGSKWFTFCQTLFHPFIA